MWKKEGLLLWLSLQLVVSSVSGSGLISYDQRPSSFGTVGRLVKMEERTPLVSTEFGAISAVDIDDGTGRHNYHLQFITLEPNSLFLPVLLHSDMVFYVHTGSGRLNWADTDDEKLREVELQRGDVYRLRSGSLFYLHSGLESERPRLRIIALFANGDELEEPFIGPYSSINDLIRGFDTRVLQAAFQVPEEVIEELSGGTDTPAIVHAETKQRRKKKKFWEKDALFIDALLGIKGYNREAAAADNKKKKHSKSKTFNFFKADPDFHNCNGWSTVVTKHNVDALDGSHIGVFMVNLTKGAMMGPHWNPKATEVSVVLEGEGMVRVVCPSTVVAKECKNARFRVEEGDVFMIPRFHPMAQTSFNNGSLVFMGFSTTTKRNHPQFLAGKASVLNALDRLVLGASFNVSNTTIDQLLAAQEESVILECTSCAEEEEVLMEREIEEERQEEEERRREEEQRRRQEEERKRREEERKREEEERRRQEEEERRRQEEEEERRRREEERRRQEEEERRRREEEEEEEKRQREEEQRRQEAEEEEEQRQREEEEQRQREEEEQRRQEGEQQRQEEEQKRCEEEEEEARRREEEQRRQEEEEQRQQEEEEARQREEEQRRQEEEQRRQAGEERRRREERGRGQEETEEEAARREEEERVERQRQEEEAARRRREHEEHEWDLVKMAWDRDQRTGASKKDRRRFIKSSFAV